ncbi:MAG: bifunctional enoyl-CoA hydratase/phosphate acetyltransferase [Vulcanimicrobiaceae bacterium]
MPASDPMELRVHHGFTRLIEMCKGRDPLPTAVVHPCDGPALEGAIAAVRARLIVPILVGNEAKIREAASRAHIDLSGYEIVGAAHSHEAASKAVALVRAGRVQALMKGSLHSDELMHEVTAQESGLRTERRMSHVFAMDLPEYPHPLLVTDAVVNIYPTLEEKRDIVQNAIDLARTLGILTPKVALLSAVETINPKITSTIDAAALCKMADRGQITGGILDGPLALDDAISEDAAREKGIRSAVAGHANVLVMPDLESANMLAKELILLAHADAAGLVVGARVPVILTSRADSTRNRVASAAMALLYAASKQSYRA